MEKFRLAFLLSVYLFTPLSFKLKAQDTLYFKHHNLRVENKTEFRYYGVKSYPTNDSNQVILTKYYRNNYPMSRTFYVDYERKIKHNDQMLFYSNGKLAKSLSYNNDTLHGYSIMYSLNGELREKNIYNKGELISSEVFDSTQFDLTEFIEKGWIVRDLQMLSGCENEKDIWRCMCKKIFSLIQDRSEYPKNQVLDGDKVIIYVRFSVDKTGNVSNVEIPAKNIISDTFNTAVINAVKSLPKFYPAHVFGEPIEMWNQVPVYFWPDGFIGFRKYSFTSINARNSFFINEKLVSNKEIENYQELNQDVDQLPIWPSCKESVNKTQIVNCTEQKIQEYLNANVIYPLRYKGTGKIEQLIVQFTVGSSGKIKFPKIIKGSEYLAFETAVIKATYRIPKMIPARYNGFAKSFNFMVVVEVKEKSN